ncbi:MAG: DNA-3-methyladenine glycosylase 2 family protein [Gemmatimonadetes bacterium]|nr:DNA-3-methyladenine glycosylase 2 family protein [Gemmatimonadota bacterium]
MSGRGALSQVIPPEALGLLSERDPVLGGVIDRVGAFEPSHEPDLWWSLVDAIISQQLSVKAAATIAARVAALGLDGQRPTPEAVLEISDETFRACGLSRAKTLYVKDLAAKWLDDTLEPHRLHSLSDDGVVEHLVRVKGIGRWTAEMFLIFTLRRPDVLPVDDLGLRVAVQRAYGLPKRPGRAELERIGSAWRPYRSAATLVLWRSLKAPAA